MKNRKVLAALCAFLLFMAAPTLLKAQDNTGTNPSGMSQNSMSQDIGAPQTVTFSNKVELPGLTLDKGSYTFKVIRGNQTDHQVIQVFNSDGSKFQGNILALSDSRITIPSGQNFVMYPQGTSSNVQAVRAWMPSSGQPLALVYSKSEATKLAKNNNQTVPYSDVSGLSDQNKSGQIMEASINGISPSGQEIAWSPSSSSSNLDQSRMNSNSGMSSDQHGSNMNPSNQMGSSDQSQSSSRYGSSDQSQSMSSSSTDRSSGTDQNTVDHGTNLPRTASSLPLIGLIGLLSVGAAVLLRLRS